MIRMIITAVAGALVSTLFGYLLLPVLRALKAGQSVRDIGPTWHNSKAGTPLMGGLMFIGATVLCLLGNLPFMTDHTAFYERYGWTFLTMVTGDDHLPERMYTAPTLPPASGARVPPVTISP